jgi:hypothetical protein
MISFGISIYEFWKAQVRLTRIDRAHESKVKSPFACGVPLNFTISLNV